MQEIVDSLHEETVAADEPFFQRKYMRPILLAFMVATFNQFSGINAILYYSNHIFTMAGAGQTSALAQSIIIGLTNLIFTLVGMSVIDHFGRRKTADHRSGRLDRLPVGDRLGLLDERSDHGGRVVAFLRAGDRLDRARESDRLHRLLRFFVGGGHLGVHQRDLPQPRSRPRAGAGQFHALVLVRPDRLSHSR